MTAVHIIASRRAEFVQRWQPVLAPHALVAYARSAGALDALRSRPPQLCVLDPDLVGESRLADTVAWLAHQTCLLLDHVTTSVDEELHWLAAGVRACCTPELEAADLGRIVDVTLQGGIWVSRGTLPVLLGRLQRFTATNTPVPAPAPPPVHPVSGDAWQQLTPREREVAELVGGGANNKAIARKLSISDRTVKSHLTSIFGKLGVNDRVHLALFVTGHQ